MVRQFCLKSEKPGIPVPDEVFVSQALSKKCLHADFFKIVYCGIKVPSKFPISIKMYTISFYIAYRVQLLTTNVIVVIILL